MTLESQLQDRSRIDRLDRQFTVAAAEAKLDQARFLAETAHRLYVAARPSEVWTFRHQWREAEKVVLEAQRAVLDAMGGVDA